VLERPLEKYQSAVTHLSVYINPLQPERIENRLPAIVNDADAKLAARETGADVGDSYRYLFLALTVQSADVVGRTDLLYCRSNFFVAINGFHGASQIDGKLLSR
jgi:hypothetical protein